MWKTAKAFLYWFVSAFDLTWELWKKQLENIYDSWIVKWFKVDKMNIAKDFDKSIQNLVK